MSESTKKRKNDSDTPAAVPKKMKMSKKSGRGSASTSQVPAVRTSPPDEPVPEVPVDDSGSVQATRKDNEKGKKNKELQSTRQNSRRRINKLKPARPFPTVPASVSATGPRSAHREGKNMICITRNTSLGAYMRRCKKVVIEDGYKTLHFSAMGAAIPHLLQLVCALPPILPFPQDEIHWEVTTGSVEVQDEIIPDEEEEDISYQTRCKSNLSVVFKIGDGGFDGDCGAVRRYSAGKSVPKSHNPTKNEQGKKDKGKEKATEIVFEEPEQEFMDTL